jgi:hypothetical protein
MNLTEQTAKQASAGNETGSAESAPGSIPQSDLSPWPIRVIAFLALVGIALLAIEVIDYHVMQQATQSSNQKISSPTQKY